MSFPFPPNPVDGQVATQAQPDGTVLKATYIQTKNEWVVERVAPKPSTLTLASGTAYTVTPGRDGQVLTYDANLNQWLGKALSDDLIANHLPKKLTELRDVHQGYAPGLGEQPVWSYASGDDPVADGQFFFRSPNAHIKTWNGVTHWESGAVVYHHSELWRAVHENTNVQPAMEDGRVTLFINSPGEPSFGLVPMGLSSGPPPSGDVDEPSSKFPFWVDYISDQQVKIWKWEKTGVNPTTLVPYGQWVQKTSYMIFVWRGLTPPPAVAPVAGSICTVWIYSIPESSTPPVLGQQMWAYLELDGNLINCRDVDARTPKHGDLLQYNSATGKWAAVPGAARTDRHPVRVVTENPVVVSETDYHIVLDLPTSTQPVVTLPNAAANKGRELHFKSYRSAAAISAANDVRSNKAHEDIVNGITAAADGAWSTLVSDGTYWMRLQSYPTTQD